MLGDLQGLAKVRFRLEAGSHNLGILLLPFPVLPSDITLEKLAILLFSILYIVFLKIICYEIMLIPISCLSLTVPIQASGPPSSGPRAGLQIVHLPLRPIEGALGRIVCHQGLVPRDLQRKGKLVCLSLWFDPSHRKHESEKASDLICIPFR